MTQTQLVIKILPKKKSPGPDGSLLNSTKLLKNPNPSQTAQKSFQSSYEASINLIPKWENDTTKKTTEQYPRWAYMQKSNI